MVYIILFLISVLSISTLSIVAKKTKVPVLLWLILVGILFGSYGFYDLFGKLDAINTNVPELSIVAGWAVNLLFLMSGLGINIPAIKNSGKNTVFLSTVPVYLEGLVMGIIAFVILSIMPIAEFKFSLPFYMMVMCIFAMSAPAIVIPICFKAKAQNPKGQVYDEMIVASVLDNFAPFPVLIVYFTVALALANGVAISVGNLTTSVIVSIVALGIAYVMGHVLGLLMSFIAKIKSINNVVVVVLHIILTLVLISISGPIGASYGIVIGFGSGIGFNMALKDNPNKPAFLDLVQKIYGLLFMPTIFLYVGTQIKLDLLLNPIIIITLSILTACAIVIKGFVAKKYLKAKGYPETEVNLSGSLFAAKGVILINISLILAPALINAKMDNVLQFMYILAAVSTLISVPYSIIKSEKILKNN